MGRFQTIIDGLNSENILLNPLYFEQNKCYNIVIFEGQRDFPSWEKVSPRLEMIDVLEQGIVDSAAAVIETLKNSSAAAGQLLSLSGLVNTPLKIVQQQQM